MNEELERLFTGYNFMRDIIIPSAVAAEIIPSDIKKMKTCLSNFSVYKCKCCGSLQIASANRCKNRFCVMCQHLRTKKWLAKLIPILIDWRKQGNYICMLNLTLKDMDSLRDMIFTINQAWRTMTHENKSSKEWFSDRFPGGLRSLEVVIGQNSRQWHCHLHCIVIQDSYARDYNDLESRWNKACCSVLGLNHKINKVGSVYIKAITNDLEQSLLEVIKYILKPNLDLYLNPLQFREAYENLKSRRQVNTWGLFRRIAKEVENELKKNDYECEDCGCNDAIIEFIDLGKENIYDHIKT